MPRTSLRAAVIGVALLALPVLRALADDYPSRGVTIVAPSAPGGMYSILARLIGAKLERRYGKSFIVENRPGASSVTGAVAVVRAPADGYTLMVATSSTMATNVSLHKNLPYDPLADFIPLVLIARSPEVLLTNAALPARSIADLVALARVTPGGLSFGSAGPGTAQHLNGEMLKAALGIEMQHVPYKGIQPALNDLAGGHIALMTAPIPVALPLVQGAKVRMLGVTTKERVEAIADVPALAEIGVDGYNAASWFMLVAPARTPRAIVEAEPRPHHRLLSRRRADRRARARGRDRPRGPARPAIRGREPQRRRRQCRCGVGRQGRRRRLYAAFRHHERGQQPLHVSQRAVRRRSRLRPDRVDLQDTHRAGGRRGDRAERPRRPRRPREGRSRQAQSRHPGARHRRTYHRRDAAKARRLQADARALPRLGADDRRSPGQPDRRRVGSPADPDPVAQGRQVCRDRRHRLAALSRAA